MTTAAEETLTTLRERRRQLSDRLDELSAQAIDITDDIVTARTDWTDSVECCSEDSTLLAQRLHLREAELLDNRTAVDHLTSVLAGVDAQISGITARAQLADDAASYRATLVAYTAALPGLPDSLPSTVEVIGDALTELIDEIDGARASHDELLATAGSLRQRAEQLGADVDAPAPASWPAGLERVHHRDAATRQLMLALLQQRGVQSVISEITRLIMLDAEAKRKALQ
jgi:hypothetical protein